MTAAIGETQMPSASSQPGRTCPPHYRYAPSVLARAPELHAETVYVIGGLYGNRIALERILELAANEAHCVTLVFNGDFNWFNVDRETFATINAEVLAHAALRGNVETEIAAEDEGVGCGCAYPEYVGDAEVARSNAIIKRLRETATAFPAVRGDLAALPMHLVAEVGGMRVAVVHGDAEALAGWAYSEQALTKAAGVQRLRAHLDAAQARVLASSHTCLPVALGLETARGPCALINNGAAGMPNFRGTRYGVITRISTRPAAHALYSIRIGAVHVEALALHYEHRRWVEAFLSNWPPGSAAHVSYFRRITEGPAYDLMAAARGTAYRACSTLSRKRR